PGAAQQSFPPVYNPANGHWYQAVPIPGGIPWPAARAAAAAQSYAGYPGHLVTITSAAEDQFLVSSLPLGLDNHWRVGGYQDQTAPDYSEPAGGWRWVTGEPWSYTNWHAREPRGRGREPQQQQPRRGGRAGSRHSPARSEHAHLPGGHLPGGAAGSGDDYCRRVIRFGNHRAARTARAFRPFPGGQSAGER